MPQNRLISLKKKNYILQISPDCYTTYTTILECSIVIKDIACDSTTVILIGRMSNLMQFDFVHYQYKAPAVFPPLFILWS